MLILGGYLFTYDQLYQLGLRRGLVIEGGKSHILYRDFREKGIDSIYAGLSVIHGRNRWRCHVP